MLDLLEGVEAGTAVVEEFDGGLVAADEDAGDVDAGLAAGWWAVWAVVHGFV